MGQAALGSLPLSCFCPFIITARGCLPEEERLLPCRAEPHADQDSSCRLQITAMIIMLFFGILIGSLGEIVSTASHNARRAQLFR